MLVCPSCKGVQREGAGVCLACGFRFTPGTDEVTEARPTPKAAKVPRRVIGLVVALVLAAGLFLVKPTAAVTGSTAQAGLDSFVSRVSTVMDAAGTIDPAAADMLVSAAETASGCGHVHMFLIPASALGTPPPGATGAVPSPESRITEYLRTAYGADYAAAEAALEGAQYVAAGGWACDRL